MHTSSGDMDKRSYFHRVFMVNTIYIAMLKIMKTIHFDPALFRVHYLLQIRDKMWTSAAGTALRYNEIGVG